MTTRPARILAIARRDLFQELKGRRGALFGAVTALLLMPVAAIRVDLPAPGERPARETWVAGDVPEEVVALPRVRPTDGPAQMVFQRQADGRLVVRTQHMPPTIRAALDGPSPQVSLEEVDSPLYLPGRTLLFALISASVLTGAVSESIGGERSRRTLQSLLSAAVSRGEIVTGKWLAWTGYGALAALLTAGVALLLGRVEPGWWLLPLPTVAAGTVALAMYLSRHARDVVGGATVSLRYLPAVLSGTGVVAWYLGGEVSFLAGAALPIGGALLAAGDAWPGAAPAVVGALSTGLFTATLLWATGRDLERAPRPPPTWLTRAREAGLVALVAGVAWWCPLAAPLLWGAAGNPLLTETLPRAPGVWAGATALLLMSVVRSGKVDEPRRELGLVRPRAGWWKPAVVAAVGLVVASAASGLVPLPEESLVAAAGLRISAGLNPLWAGIPAFLLAVVAQELLYRGWLQRLVGPLWGTAVFVLVHGPLDPMWALFLGGSLAAVTRSAGGSVLPAIGVRVLWAVTGPAPSGIGPAMGLAVGAVLIAILAIQGRGAPAEAAAGGREP